jgi:hypothetical protein
MLGEAKDARQRLLQVDDHRLGLILGFVTYLHFHIRSKRAWGIGCLLDLMLARLHWFTNLYLVVGSS